MHLTTYRGDGRLELNYAWLPTWIGMNSALKRELETSLRDAIVGRRLTEVDLSEIDGLIRAWFARKFPSIEGLSEYLEGVKFVVEPPSRAAPSTPPRETTP